MKMYYTYMLQCADGTLYSGYTADVEKRLAAHNRGKGAKYTRARLPVSIVFVESFETKGEAIRREYALKALSHKEKLGLIEKKPS